MPKRRIGCLALVLPLTFLLAACAGDDDNGPPRGIGAGGGAVTSGDGKASVTIPAGALSQPTVITVGVAPSPPAGNVGTAYEFGPDGTTFSQPATIQISYDPANLPAGVKAADLVLAKVVNGQWQAVLGSGVSPAIAAVFGPATTFSVWGIIPLIPGGLSAVQGESQVTLSWNPQFNASSYNIYWATDAGVTTSANRIANVLPPYVHSDLTNGTTYYYKVSANTPEEGSLSAAEVSATPLFASAQVNAALGGLIGSNATLTVVVTSGLGTPLKGIAVELAATGGTLSSTSGTTDATGTVTAVTTLDLGSPDLTVQVTARTGPGGDVIGETVVAAHVGTGVQGCEVSGQAIDFVVDNNAGTLFWAADPRIDPADPAVQSLIKFRMNVPAGQLPTGVSTARLRIGPISSELLPSDGHIGTAFNISSVDPTDLVGFTGTGQTPLTLTLRYDPAACWIPEDVESDLVLGRLNASGVWQAVCGDLADTGLAVREVTCSDGDLSFGIFGVIRGAPPDTEPPVFPANTFTLSTVSRCDICALPSISLEWGPADDGSGSGILGYWIYVDGVRTAFTWDTTADPTVAFTLESSATLDTTQEHFYQVQAVDFAGNVSSLFGALRT